jgi:hypothetical protein
VKFEKGHAKVGGRQKGSPNKRTEAVRDLLARLKCDPLEVLAHIAKGSKKPLKLQKGESVPLELRYQAARELAGYIAPKLKTIEHTGPGGGPVEVMTYDFSQLPIEERAELLRLIQAAKQGTPPGASGDPGEADGEEGDGEG